MWRSFLKDWTCFVFILMPKFDSSFKIISYRSSINTNYLTYKINESFVLLLCKFSIYISWAIKTNQATGKKCKGFPGSFVNTMLWFFSNRCFFTYNHRKNLWTQNFTSNLDVICFDFFQLWELFLFSKIGSHWKVYSLLVIFVTWFYIWYVFFCNIWYSWTEIMQKLTNYDDVTIWR